MINQKQTITSIAKSDTEMKRLITRKTPLFLIILSCPALLWCFDQAASFPEAKISNGIVHAHLLLPDVEKGYYRGSRFDWSGVIAQLEYKDHTYFGQWFPKYDPYLHDAIMGPVEAFDPIDYESAKPGEHFLKIGVGILKKISDQPYRIADPYEILDHGKWKTEKKKDKVRFVHTLTDASGYAYEYTKTVELVKGKPEMRLVHELKNKGKKRIETQVYNHNFFMLDDEPIGPDYSVGFPFELEVISNTRGMGTVTKAEGKTLSFIEAIPPRESVYFVLGGYSDQPEDYDITIQNNKTGTGVRITNDRPISHLPFWSISTTLCPEPYMLIEVDPGKTQTWITTYSFFAKE